MLSALLSATSGIVGISLPLHESDKLSTNAASAASAVVELGRKEPEDEEEDEEEEEEEYEEEHAEAEALTKGKVVEEEGEEEEMEVVVEVRQARRERFSVPIVRCVLP